METPTLHELKAEAFRLSKVLDGGIEFLYEIVREAANKDSEATKEWSVEYLKAEGKVAERKAQADLKTEKIRLEAALAKGLEAAAKEATRCRRTQISLYQTAMNLEIEEMRFSRTGPEF